MFLALVALLVGLLYGVGLFGYWCFVWSVIYGCCCWVGSFCFGCVCCLLVGCVFMVNSVGIYRFLIFGCYFVVAFNVCSFRFWL